MGLIHATSGAAYLMGEQVPARHARERVGFLPESPYFYDFLTATELCDLLGSPMRLRAGRPRFTRHAADAGR